MKGDLPRNCSSVWSREDTHCRVDGWEPPLPWFLSDITLTIVTNREQITWEGMGHLNSYALCTDRIDALGHVWRPEVDIRYLPRFPPYFLRQGLSLNPEVTELARLASQQTPECLLSLISDACCCAQCFT